MEVLEDEEADLLQSQNEWVCSNKGESKSPRTWDSWCSSSKDGPCNMNLSFWAYFLSWHRRTPSFRKCLCTEHRLEQLQLGAAWLFDAYFFRAKCIGLGIMYLCNRDSARTRIKTRRPSQTPEIDLTRTNFSWPRTLLSVQLFTKVHQHCSEPDYPPLAVERQQAQMYAVLRSS